MTDTHSFALAVDAMHTAHRAARESERAAVAQAQTCGERLVSLKATVGEREWPAWVREHCRFTPAMAEFYAKLAKFMTDPASAARASSLSLRDLETILAK